MLKIQEMAEVVKGNGVFIYEFVDDGSDKMNQTARKSFGAEQFFWQAFRQNNVFVFSPLNKEPSSLDMDVSDLDFIKKEMRDFHQPFNVFSIEVANQNITTAHPTSDRKIDIGCIMIYDMGAENKFESRKNLKMLFVLYYFEKKPYVFMEFVGDFKSDFDKSTQVEMFCINIDGKKMSNFVMQNIYSEIIKKMTDRLNSQSSVGVESVDIKIHYRGKHNSREKAEIRKIVHIVPKKYRPDYKPVFKKEIEWTHRFWRRGTWVNFYKEDGSIDMSKLGKNREGEYVEFGRTWRIESIVNSDREDLPLVSKTRVVSQNDADDKED